jgi:hypothetical protein
MSHVKRLILVAFFLEVGFLLIVLPWSAFWERNYFAQTVPFVRDVITNNFVRGAISGLGLVNVYVGLVELVSVLASRHADPPPSPFSASQITPKD